MIRELVQGILADYEGKKLTKKMVAAATARIVAAVSMLRHDTPVVTAKTEEIAKESVTVTLPPPVIPAVPIVEAPATPKDAPPVEVKATAEVIETDKHKAIVMQPPKAASKPKNKAIVAMPIGSLGESLDPRTGATVDQDVGTFIAKAD